MSRPNRIELEPRLKKAADAAIRRGATVDRLVDVLNALVPAGDDPISRSGAHRYLKKFKPVMAKNAEAREIAKVWVEEFGKEPEGDIGQLLPQMLHAVAFSQVNMMANETPDLSGKEGVSPRHVAMLAAAIKDIASAQKITAERILKVRKETAEKAATAVEKVAKASGMTKDTIEKLRAAVIGTGQ
jgi:hypothetical protein